jgi:hypothetical protein
MAHVLELVVTNIVLQATFNLLIGWIILFAGYAREYIISIGQRLVEVGVASGTITRNMDGLTSSTGIMDLAV